MRRNDPVVLLEAGLVLLLLALFLFLYILPAERTLTGARWWYPVILGLLFAGVMAVDAWRRYRRDHRGLRELMKGDEHEA